MVSQEMRDAWTDGQVIGATVGAVILFIMFLANGCRFEVQVKSEKSKDAPVAEAKEAK
jgi:hypothetical protein